MSTKGRDGGMTEKRGRSPSLPFGQRKSSPTPSILDRKKGSTSIETKKVSSSNLKKQPSDNNKPPRSLPPSKVTSTRSKPNQKNVTRPSTKITGSTKPKDVGKSRPPLRPKNVMNVKENTNASSKKQTKKGLENNVVVSEQNRIISDAPPSSKEDHNIVTHEDNNKTVPVFDNVQMSDCSKQLLEDENDDILNNVVEIETPLPDPIALSGNQDMPESEIRYRDNVTIDGSVDQEHTNDHDNEINVQDQVNETSEIASDRLLVPDHPKVVDQENEGLEIERVVQDPFIGSKYVEQVESNDQDHKETPQKEPEYKKPDPEEPEHGETDLKEPEPEESDSKEPQEVETKVPEEPEHQETEVREEPEHQETEVREEPEHQETEVPEEPEYQETELPEEPENKETELPEEPENKETELPEEPENKETEVPEDPEKKETELPEEPENKETELPEEPENKETELPEEPEAKETELPEEPENKETEVPEEPENKETELPEEPENKETQVPEELNQEETQVPEEPDHEETEPREPEHQETEPKEQLETKEQEETIEPEEPKQQETEQKESENEKTEAKEAEMKEGGTKEGNLGSKMVVKKQEVVAYGKKETATAYNDVIEETVSKLRRQRKNRVKALVGAFETVISLESYEC